MPEQLALAVRHAGVDLRRKKGLLPLVEDVSFEVRPAEVCGIVGETGAGKTLTMRGILGLLPPGLQARGSVQLGDRSVDLATSQASRRELLGRDLSVVLQNPAGMLDPVMKIGKQLCEGVLYRRLLSPREARRRGRDVLTAVGFAEPDTIWTLYPHQLSGGMSQRVGIAMAMMAAPRVLVVDEPTSALDVQLRAEVLRVIRNLAHTEQTAVVLISHDLSLVGHFCDSVVVMYAGRSIEQGRSAEVLTRPQHPYAIALRAVSPSIDSTAHRERSTVIPGVPPRPGEWPSGCVFESRCPRARTRCRLQRPRLDASDTPHPVACHFPGAVDPGARANGVAGAR